jgi:uncharacterized protein
MKLAILLSLLIICITSGAQKKSTFPQPMGFINDYEGDFTGDEARQLNDAVKSLLAKTMQDDSLKGIEIAVVTVTPEMFGDAKEMSAYATQLGDKWGVGKKGVNKAIIIAYSKSVRKVSIVTGSGLDWILSPAICHRIIDERMAPEFKNGKYFNALMGAIDGLKEYLVFKR